MSWIQCKVALLLSSPMHIGWRKAGNLQQTRRYVTGKVFWAALTARLTRDMGRGNQKDAYADIGTKIHEYFRFGYFYTALKKKDIKKIESVEDLTMSYPWDVNFDYLFLDSYASTAMDCRTGVSAEGTLHEVEFISPKSRRGEQVYLVGDIWVKDMIPEETKYWDTSLEYLQLGGERGYGWGRVRPVFDPVAICEENKDAVEVKIKSRERVLAHVDARNIQDELSGSIEPLVGWERDAGRGGWALTKNVELAFIPGSVVTCDQVSFVIDKFGIWKIRPKDSSIWVV
jgi:hypothetical protein